MFAQNINANRQQNYNRNKNYAGNYSGYRINNSNQHNNSSENTKPGNAQYKPVNPSNPVNSRGVQIVEMATENEEIGSFAGSPLSWRKKEVEDHSNKLVEEETTAHQEVYNVVVKSEELLEEDTKNLSIGGSPRVLITVGGNCYSTLLDSGSEVSLMSPLLYDKLKLNRDVLSEFSSKRLAMQGPFTNSKKCYGIKQILVSVMINQCSFLCVFAVVELNERRLMVMGDNFLRENKMCINYETCRLEFKFEGRSERSSFLEEETKQSKHVCLVTLGDTELRKRIEQIITDAGTKYGLSMQEKKIFERMLWAHKNVFSDQPGLVNHYEHRIEMRDLSPVFNIPFPIPIAIRQDVQKEINQMIDWGIIQEANTPYVSSLIVVRKTNETLRLCVDLRTLNKMGG
jgi:hypothetical protein